MPNELPKDTSDNRVDKELIDEHSGDNPEGVEYKNFFLQNREDGTPEYVTITDYYADPELYPSRQLPKVGDEQTLRTPDGHLVKGKIVEIKEGEIKFKLMPE